MPSDNIEMLRALGKDPLVIKRTRIDALKGLVDLMSNAETALPAIPAEACPCWCCSVGMSRSCRTGWSPKP